MALTTLLKLMQAETVLCNEIGTVLESVLQAVMKRDTAEAQTALDHYRELASSLAGAEAMRTKVFEQICDSTGCRADGGVSVLVSHVAPELGPRFADAIRSFRTAVFRLRGINQGLASYTEASLVTLESFLVELFPDRHNGLYGADGSMQSTGRPVLVNSLG